MPEKFIAEREYLRCEHDRSRPVGLLVLGLLLGYAFGRQTSTPASNGSWQGSTKHT